jgi:hypothetical protein
MEPHSTQEDFCITSLTVLIVVSKIRMGMRALARLARFLDEHIRPGALNQRFAMVFSYSYMTLPYLSMLSLGVERWSPNNRILALCVYTSP